MISHPPDPGSGHERAPESAPGEGGLGGSLATEQVDAMVAAWRRGERPLVEDFLASHPDLGDEAVIRLVYEEFCLRQEAGLAVDPAEFVRRFPQWRDELEVLLDCHRLMESGPPPIVLPSVGETFAGFRLLAELGRGVSGQVYLASQPALADRPVVLKVAPLGREEHLSLARLQHMNIVPLYSEQVLRDRSLQVLCMPYLGGASLAQVLERLKDERPARRTGKQLIDALDAIQARLPVALPAPGPYRRYLAGTSYVEALCWIGACLADGLQYAHDRALVHMDIKPSNVLLASDGQPMLLDFHLARKPVVPAEPPPRWMGGTPEFMAPEQRTAVTAVREGQPIPARVDGRADLYSLALLLYEALGGSVPAGSGGGPLEPLYRCNPRVSVGLSDVIAKCLSVDPDDRYPDAAALADDLRRHLNDLPLRGVPNRSLSERYKKWRKRRPLALSRGLTLLVLAVTATAGGVLAWVAYHQRVHDIESALADSRALLERQRYHDALNAAERGLALASRFPAVPIYRRSLDDQYAVARRALGASELHRLAEFVRFRYGLDPPPRREALELIRRGRSVWAARAALLRPVAGRTETEIEQSIHTDLLDLILVWADLRVRLAPAAESDAARNEALRVLDEAASLLGPSPALARDRARLAGQEQAQPDSPGPAAASSSSGDLYELGRSYLRSGDVAQAAAQFEQGLQRRPQDFWLNFYQGLCAYRLERYAEAVVAFSVCIALEPETAECYYNRALAHAALGHEPDALRDYSRALDLNPSLTSAALNRGILHYKAGRLPAAEADLKQAISSTRDHDVLGVIHYNLALVALARGDRSAARTDLERAGSLGHEGARELLGRLGAEGH